MATEQFTNNAQTTLNNGGNVASGDTSFVVTSASGFPLAANFRIIIDSEIMLVTGLSGTTWTVLRAQEGTSAASHTNGAAVTHVLTSGSMLQAMIDRSQIGTFSARPSDRIAGRRYQCTDCPFWYYDDGTNWNKFFGSYPLVTPNDGSYSWDNQSGAGYSTTQDMLTISNFSSSGMAFRYKTAPSAPKIIDTAWLINFNPRETVYYSIGYRDSSGKLVLFAISFNNSGLPQCFAYLWQFSSSTTYNSYYYQNNAVPIVGGLIFMRMQDDGTNLNFYFSTDGVNYALYGSKPRTDYLSAPTYAVFGFSGASSSGSLIHWKEH